MSEEKMDITPEELKRFEVAMKKEEFRKLLCEYAEEISSPENRKKYEEEIAQMENERGMDIKFINPEPGHVLKSTLNGNENNKKAFINICKNENVEKPSFTKESGPNGRGTRWSIPHSLTRPRDDLDKNGQKCSVYDVVFHPDTYRMAKSNPRFKKLVHDTALDAIEQHFNVSLDKKNIKTPKIKNNYKGAITSSVLRTRREGQPGQSDATPQDSVLNQMPYPYDSNKTTEEATAEWLEKEGKKKSSKKSSAQSKESTQGPSSSSSSSKEVSSSASPSAETSSSKEDQPITPKYTIVHRSAIDLQEFRNVPDAKTSTRPKELVICIDLPGLNSANTVDLDIVENYIMLKCTTPASYELELRLPYPIDDTNGTAKFDKSKSQLNITLPVIAAQPPEPLMSCSPEEEDASSDVDSERGASMDDGSELSYDSPSPGLDKDCEDLNSDDAVMKSLSDSETCGMLTSTALCQLPPLVFSQDDKTVTVVMDVSNINPNSIVQKYYKKNMYDLFFVSEGSGCFPIHYRLLIQFPEGCNLCPDEDVLDRSEENLVALLCKDEKSQELWNGFLVGFDENNLEHLCFESFGGLEKTLEELECCESLCTMPQAHDIDYHLDVTELDEKHISLDIQVTRGITESDTTDTESHVYPHIEVIHRKRTPSLHGILKQRSRTISDSSDENGAVLSASPGSSSAGEGHFPSVKKSVSFNEKIDQATFKINSTITSMHNSLKSKRKRTRQREERRKNGRRRRRNDSNESSEGEDAQSKEKGNNSSTAKNSHKVSQGKNSKKKAASASDKNSLKQEGAASSSNVEETDETTNTEGSDKDTDSGYDNNDSSKRNSSVPESSPPESKNDDVDHYNLRPRGGSGSKSEPKNSHGTKNCSHSHSIILGNDRTDFTSEERTKLDRIMTTALNQTLRQIKPITTNDTESLEVPEYPEVDPTGPSKAQVIDTMAHMASLSIDAAQMGSVQNSVEKNFIDSSDSASNSNSGDTDNSDSLLVSDQEKSLGDEKNIVVDRVREKSNDVSSRAESPKDDFSDCDKKSKNSINGKNGQKTELDNFRSPKIESVLSWTDTEYSKQGSNEHHTHCAFPFNNNVMFELD